MLWPDFEQRLQFHLSTLHSLAPHLTLSLDNLGRLPALRTVPRKVQSKLATSVHNSLMELSPMHRARAYNVARFKLLAFMQHVNGAELLVVLRGIVALSEQPSGRRARRGSRSYGPPSGFAMAYASALGSPFPACAIQQAIETSLATSGTPSNTIVEPSTGPERSLVINGSVPESTEARAPSPSVAPSIEGAICARATPHEVTSGHLCVACTEYPVTQMPYRCQHIVLCGGKSECREPARAGG